MSTLSDTASFPSVTGLPPVAPAVLGTPSLDQNVGYHAGEGAEQAGLIQARLGAGSSLFTALRCKHPPTAAHSLRVALSCSAWGMAVELDAESLSDLEVAALLHDIGKIGVPDAVLLKPGQLDDAETALVRRHREMGLEILKSFGAPDAVRKIVRWAPQRYADHRGPGSLSEEALPKGARMLAIADAFDSMTHQQVFRDALSHNQALERLVDAAGTQFDPRLVREFFDVAQVDNTELHAAVARRWLRQLAPASSPLGSRWGAPGFPAAAESLAPLFLERLVGSMRDGVVCVDNDLNIRLWNQGAEVLTGTSADEATQESWRPGLLSLMDEQSHPIADEECPVREVLQSSAQSFRRLQIRGRQQRKIAVDLHIVPVVGSEGETQGANIFMRDVSSETDLEKQCATLHEKATRDPLTKVANRAEFDRQHEAFVEQHRNRDEPGSLIICDIDHFKGINDTYGHPAGDDALRRFAQMLAENCRPGDLVARYGGEEFVLLCADCDQAAASRRAEKIRHQIANTPLSVLGGKRITASFGVTQTAAEDTPSLMLGRADKALLEAKAAGRNLVVTVSPDGVGRMTRSAGGWFPWWQPGAAVPVAKTELLADVPLGVAIEKLRGFVAEHKAHVKPLDDHRVMLRFEPKRGGILRRESDRAVAFLLELGFCEEATLGGSRPGQVRTRVTVAVRPRRGRDRRRRDVVARARAVINYLQTYLIARPADGNEEPVERRETDLTGTWLEA